MPVYFGHPVNRDGKQKIEVSQNLREQGINLLRAAPSQVYMFTVPFTDSVLWNAFIASLSALMLSASVKANVPTNLEGFKINNRHSDPLPIRYPDLCIQILNPGPETHQWLLENGFEEQEVRKGQYYVLMNPTTAVLESLLGEDCPVRYSETNYVPLRYANMHALFAFSEIVNIFSYLLQVLSAPLWAGIVDRKTLINSSFSDRLKAYEPDDVIMSSEVPPAAEKEKEDELKEHAIRKLFGTPEAMLFFPNKSMEVNAEPLSKSLGWTSVDVATRHNNAAGVLTRFVRDLSNDDPSGVIQIFDKYIKRSLGASANEIMETMERFRSAWGLLKSTSAGHTLSHIAKSIEIAISGHCSITALFDHDFYEGCLIQGLGFITSTNDSMFSPLVKIDLAIELKALETHARVWAEIRTLLLESLDTSKVPTTITSMDKLRDLCLLADSDSADRDKIRSLAAKLRFPIRKWSINLATINDLLTTLSKGLDSLTERFPIGVEGLFSTDPLEVVMSCFYANSCPSFRHPSGVPVNLRSVNPPTPPESLKRKGGRGPQQVNNGGWIFTIRRVSFEEAVFDFRMLARDWEARSMSSAAARNLGYFVIAGGNFEKVFMSMRECLRNVSKSGVERSNEADPSQSSASKRILSGEIPMEVAKRQKRFLI
jgi:hypothetical protein